MKMKHEACQAHLRQPSKTKAPILSSSPFVLCGAIHVAAPWMPVSRRGLHGSAALFAVLFVLGYNTWHLCTLFFLKNGNFNVENLESFYKVSCQQTKGLCLWIADRIRIGAGWMNTVLTRRSKPTACVSLGICKPASLLHRRPLSLSSWMGISLLNAQYLHVVNQPVSTRLLLMFLDFHSND